MKYRKFNRYEKKEIKKKIMEEIYNGKGIYLYENNTSGELTLPRPTHSGRRIIEHEKACKAHEDQVCQQKNCCCE